MKHKIGVLFESDSLYMNCNDKCFIFMLVD